MHRPRIHLLLSLLVALAVGCSAQPTVTETAAARALALGAADNASLDDLADPVDPGGPAQGTGASATGAAGSTASISTAQQGPSPLDAERAEKAERAAAHDAFRRELHQVLNPDPYPLETESLPDMGAVTSATGEGAMRITTTVERITAPAEPLVVTTNIDVDTGYLHSTTDRQVYGAFLAERFDRQIPVDEIIPGTIETVVLPSSPFGQWSRGLTPEVASSAYAPLDPERWYVGDAIASAIRSNPALWTTTDLLWEQMATSMPSGEPGPSGTTVRQASLDQPRLTAFLGFVATNADEAPVTMTTTSDSDDLVTAVELQFADDQDIDRITFVIDSRGDAIAFPEITNVVQNPRGSKGISAAEYSWTATGVFRDDGKASPEGPWSAEGRIYDGRYPESLLSMTAGDASVLAGVPLTTTPPDQMIRRSGYRSVSYAVGMAPEIVPVWADTDVDPDAQYIHDPFGVPADLFPSGLDEESLWASFRSVPEVVEIDDWSNARVTRGQVPTEYWAYRQRQGSGVFAWVASEDVDEIFEVTIGADANGRMERFQLRTTDPDKGGLTFDVRIDAVAKEFLEIGGNSRAGSLRVSSDWIDSTIEAEGEGDGPPPIEDFFAASRAAYPVFDHATRPEHLTLITRYVRDEPSGAYTPQGEYFQWPDVYFGNLIVGQLGETGDGIVCLELEDNEWRFRDNTFEKYWRGFTDGSGLDGRILRHNANAWVSADIYASDGERHPADPCAAIGW